MKKFIPVFAVLLFSATFSFAQTPLAKALGEKDSVTALRLIKAGENPNQPTTQGSLLIGYCRYAEADSMALFLLHNGAKPDTLRTPAGRTALHVAAAYYGCELLCGAILDAGADINARTNDGTTPLMLAAKSAKLRLVKFLIDKGADIKLKDKAGKTVYDYALAADAMNDMPDVQKKLEAACGFNKAATIAFLKEKMQQH